MKKVKEPAPHVKAAQIEKEAVRALSVNEVEEALTKSTYGINEAAGKIAEAFKSASKKAGEVADAVMTDEVREKLDLLDELEPLDEDDNIIKDIEAENERLRRENLHLRRTIEETGMAERNKGIEVLKTECLDLKEEKNRLLRELDDMKKTISKMKYTHEEEVKALNDDIMEAKTLGKKAGEYCSMLDADNDSFETILELAKIIHGLAKNAESVSLLIKDEIEGHV